jgi:hypothetical protein
MCLPLASLLAAGQSTSGYGNAFAFSGYSWYAKIASPPTGPGPNYFSASPSNVSVDSQGRLHLAITRSKGHWYCAEVVLTSSLGYGTYTFYLDSPVANLDPNVVLGMFTWDDYYDSTLSDPHRELDIEFARWGSPGNSNLQYTVQPYTTKGNQIAFTVQADPARSKHSLVWQAPDPAVPGSYPKVSFGSWGFDPLSGQYAALAQASFPNAGTAPSLVPPSGGERIRMNLWLNGGKAPLNGQPVEVILKQFTYTP